VFFCRSFVMNSMLPAVAYAEEHAATEPEARISQFAGKSNSGP
jgi:hypothetical protein